MKKILSVLAAAAVALTLVGCVGEDGINWASYTKDKQNKIAFYAQVAPDATLNGTWYVPDTVFYEADDEAGAITGSNDNYKVEYTNPGSTAYRAYKETALKHAGALVKVTFKNSDTKGSKMGVIFDIKDSVSGAKKADGSAAKDFYAIAVGQELGGTYYVSKFTNIVDINAKNFGATTTATGTNPKEVEVVALPLSGNGNLKGKMPAAAADGSVSLYLYFKLAADGSFDYAILDMTDEQMNNFKGAKKFSEAKLEDYNVLVSGKTKAKAGAEYEEAKVEKTSLF
jgi:hypothetical protein